MPETINIKSDEIACIARGQAVVEARQTLDRECRILSASACAVTTPSEVFAGEARYIGKVRFDTLVLADGKIECISEIAEFSDKITSPAITAGTAITLVPEIVNVEATLEGGALKTVAVVDTSAIAVVSDEHNCIAAPEDGIYSETRTVEYCTVCAEQAETVYVTDSIAAPKLNEVICVSSRAVVTSAEAADGEVKVTGSLYTNAVVRGDDGTVSTCKAVTPFIKSISAPGAHDGNNAFATAAVTETNGTLIQGEDRLELSATVNITVKALDCRTAQAVVDVFCADNELEVTSGTTKCSRCEPMITVTDTVDGQIPLPADKLAADNVLCVGGTFCTLSDIKVDGRVTAEGLIGGDIIYYNAENNAVDTLAFRLPFSIPLAVHTDCANVYGTATVTDVNVRVRRESVFDIKADVAFTLWLSDGSECSIVESVKLGEPIERPNATVIIHIAKPGETLWQAAKALCCSPERVQQQNDKTAPYEGGERLINFCNK